MPAESPTLRAVFSSAAARKGAPAGCRWLASLSALKRRKRLKRSRHSRCRARPAELKAEKRTTPATGPPRGAQMPSSPISTRRQEDCLPTTSPAQQPAFVRQLYTSARRVQSRGRFVHIAHAPRSHIGFVQPAVPSVRFRRAVHTVLARWPITQRQIAGSVQFVGLSDAVAIARRLHCGESGAAAAFTSRAASTPRWATFAPA